MEEELNCWTRCESLRKAREALHSEKASVESFRMTCE